MKSHVTQCHRFSIPPISLTFAGKTKASGKCQQTQAEKSWAGKEKKNGKCSQVDSPSEYFVSLSHFACVFSNPTVNMPSVGKGRWWRRKRDGDTHVSFSKFSPHVAVNHFGPKKMEKAIEGAKPRPRRTTNFALEMRNARTTPPQSINRLPHEEKGLSPDWGDFIMAILPWGKGEPRVNWDARDISTKLKEGKMLKMSFRKGEKEEENHRACQFNSFLNSKSSLLAFGQNNLQYLLGKTEKEVKANLGQAEVGHQWWEGVFIRRVNMKLIWDMETFKCKYQ